MHTFHAALSGSPGELRVNHRLPTTANLSWTPVPRDKHNGVITGYRIQVMGADSTLIKEISVDKYSTTAEVSSLTPFTSYNFSISAETKAGPGPPSTSISSKTPEAGKIHQD